MKPKYYKCYSCGKKLVDRGFESSVYYHQGHKYCNKCMRNKIGL